MAEFDGALVPADVWALIIAHLPLPASARSVAPVCRTWHALLRSRSTWSELNLNYCWRTGAPDKLVDALQRYAHIVSLSLSRSKLFLGDVRLWHTRAARHARVVHETPTFLHNVPTLPYLHTLNIGSDELTLLLARAPSLTSLNLKRCHNLHDEAMNAIAQRCSNLRTLNLCKTGTLNDPWRELAQVPNPSKITTSALENLAVALSGSLTALNLSSQRSCLQVVDAFAEHLTGLRKLTLTKVTEVRAAVEVELLERWIAQCPLTYLHVDFREPHMVLKLAQLSAETLTTLTYSPAEGFARFDGEFYRKLCASCRRLRSVTFPGQQLSDHSFEEMKRCHLEAIDTDRVMQVSAIGFTRLAYFPRLKALRFITAMHDDCKNDASLQSLVLNCPEIEVLKLGKAILTPVGLAALAELKFLRRLSLDQFLAITPEYVAALSAIPQRCRFLEKIRITWKLGLDDSLVAAFANCTFLRSLCLVRSAWGTIGSVAPVLSRCILALAEGCRQLEKIRLDGTEIKDADACTKLAAGSYFLRMLSLQSCHLSDAVISAFVRGCPLLESLSINSSTGISAALFRDLENSGLVEPTQAAPAPTRIKRPLIT